METTKGNTYFCMKCAKEILVLKEGKNPAVPQCCGKMMFRRK
jgi:DNA-directed RNA polymerase subunit RPC12/RpoP